MLNNRGYVLVLLIALLLSIGTTGQAQEDTKDFQNILASIYRRIMTIGVSLINYQQQLIFRLENDRPVDLSQAEKRIRTAGRQILLLRRLAIYVENNIIGDSNLHEDVLNVKQRLPILVKYFRNNMKKIRQLSDLSFESLSEFVEGSILENVLEESSGVRIKSIEEGF